MTTAMVALKDGVPVEVEVSDDLVQQAGAALFDRVDKSIDQIGALSKTILTSFERDVLNEGGSLGVESLEVEFGLLFSGEGNVYITKMSGSANLKIKFIAKPKKEASTS